MRSCVTCGGWGDLHNGLGTCPECNGSGVAKLQKPKPQSDAERLDKLLDLRNVQDEFRGLSTEEIRARLDARRRPFATMILNFELDINIANVIRTHNSFCGREIFYLGRNKYNRRGCVGTYLYENITHFPTLEDTNISSNYTWIGVDNRPGSVSIVDFEWPENPLLVFGHERDGLDYLPELPGRCAHLINIPQAGSVRSLNVSVASGIAMYDMCRKKGWM